MFVHLGNFLYLCSEIKKKGMKYVIFLGAIFVVVAIIYYVLLVLQCWGLIKFSKEEVSFPKILIPFYYFFV